MQVGIIRFSDLKDRMDAGFHLTRQRHETRTSELETILTKDEALEQLGGIPLRAKKPLLVLERGTTSQGLSQRGIAKIEDEYPHLSIAILEANREEALMDLMTEAAAATEAVENLRRLGTGEVRSISPSVDERAQPRFRPGWIYRLNDADAYWDEEDAERYGIDASRRFDHVRIPSDEDPGDCYMVDAWVVDADAAPHPGYDACPVPVRLEDVDVLGGRPMSEPTPVRKGILDSDWIRQK